jgi:hypothetical protein
MKKQFQIILATVMLGLMLAVVPVQAQPDGRLISDIREDFNGLLVQLRTIDNSCVIILGALIDEARIDILDSRKVITVGKGNLLSLLEEALEDALVHFELANNQIEQCFALIESFVETEEGGLEGLIAEFEDGLENLDARKRLKILALLQVASNRVAAIVEKLETVQSDCVESESDVVDEVTTIIEEIQSPSNGVSETAIAEPQLTETGPIPFIVLRDFKIRLGILAAELRSCLAIIKEITKDKKWLLKAIREVKELLRASNFGGRAAAESVANIETKIYSISGKLIETQIGGLNLNRLTNGVYLAVTGNQVRKVTVVH